MSSLLYWTFLKLIMPMSNNEYVDDWYTRAATKVLSHGCLIGNGYVNYILILWELCVIYSLSLPTRVLKLGNMIKRILTCDSECRLPCLVVSFNTNSKISQTTMKG